MPALMMHKGSDKASLELPKISEKPLTTAPFRDNHCTKRKKR